MRHFVKLTGQWLRTGWFVPLVLLALPNCGLDTMGLQAGDAFNPGSEPLTSAVMCDFPKPPQEGMSPCATPQDIQDGMSIAKAAVALAEGESKPIALDYSEGVTPPCGGGPTKTEFLDGTFPDGTRVCLNCGQMIPTEYATPDAACVAKCKEEIGQSGGPAPFGGTEAYCSAHAKTSINFAPDICYDKACTDAGNAKPGWVDPRRHQEPVKWVDGFGVEFFNNPDFNSVKRNASTTGSGDADFNAGAASGQLITTGDAWVEFEAGQNDVSHVLSLRESCDNVLTCPDDNHGLDDLGFGISLNNNNGVYVLEKKDGNPLEFFGPFGTPYTPGERFRVRVTDNNDKTATITYTRLTGACADGTVCPETQIYQHVGPSPKYPLRVHTTFREVDATLEKVTLVRIKQ